jgi:diacylglycerol kinase (ATP)
MMAAKPAGALPMLVIVNPAAGRGAAARLAAGIESRLRGLGLEVRLQQSTAPGHIRDLVANALAAGERQVVVAGGDGSLNEAVNGFVDHAEPDQALGLIPIGTGNDFAKVLGTPRRWQDACDRLLRPAMRSIDAGCCNGRWFVNGVGVGLDARVALAATRVRGLSGPVTYAVGLLQVLIGHRHNPGAVIRHDGGVYAGPVSIAAAMNGRTIGGMFPVAPLADPADGRLCLVIGGDLSRSAILRLLPALLRGRHLGRPGVMHAETRRVEMRFDEPVPLQIDGEVLPDPVGNITVTLAPGALRFLV